VLNLDSHILIHALADRVTPAERKILAQSPWGISAIVLWEIEKLRALHRIELDLADFEVKRTFQKVTIFPITAEICLSMRKLDFKGDPADEIIAATSIAHDVKLLTRDRRLLASKVVPLARRA
jgi:PIN domain nuclease of toxin-antitoxin system